MDHDRARSCETSGPLLAGSFPFCVVDYYLIVDCGFCFFFFAPELYIIIIKLCM